MLLSLPTSPSETIAKQPRAGVASVMVRAMTALWTWRRRMKHRAELAEFLERADDRLLSDINLTRAILADEAGKPFWRE